MKKKILFIINPISGVRSQKIAEKLINEKIDKNIFNCEVTYTKAAKHAIELSKKGVQENFEIIVAAGGDGSVNEVGRSLVGTNSALAILPCGSGNGTARHMRIPIDLAKAIQVINRNNITKIDTFNINNEIAINTAGIGFAAHIANEFSKLKKRGFSNYLKIAVRDSYKYKSQVCEVEVNEASPNSENHQGFSKEKTLAYNPLLFGESWRGAAFIIDIANGTQWGNNAVIAPDAKNDDGLLDLCVVKDFPFINFPMMATRLFTRSIHRSKFVAMKKIKEVIIRQERTLAHIDGEPIEIGNELKVKINPLSLKVVVP